MLIKFYSLSVYDLATYIFDCFLCLQIELYNSMVKKEGTDGEKDAFKAYKAAREEDEHATESGEGDKVSSALVERVRLIINLVWKKS